jgi:agmatinase
MSDDGGLTVRNTCIFSGEPQGTFLRLPYVPAVAEKIRAHGAKVAFYGTPWDMTSVTRTGANYGPKAIREVSYQFTTYNANFDFDLLDATNAVDTGDVFVTCGNAHKSLAEAQRVINEILAGGAMPVGFGGDHSNTIAAARAIKEHFSGPGLVVIDSHPDTAEEVGGETESNCCPIARAVDAGFAPDRMVLIGINGWLNPRSELDYCRTHGIQVYWCEDVWEKGTKWIVDRAIDIAGNGTDGIYLSVDIDCLDGAFAPACSSPGYGALTAREAIELVRGISSHGLLGLDIPEVAPTLESSTTRTAGLAAKLCLDALAFHFGASVKPFTTQV